MSQVLALFHRRGWIVEMSVAGGGPTVVIPCASRGKVTRKRPQPLARVAMQQCRGARERYHSPCRSQFRTRDGRYFQVRNGHRPAKTFGPRLHPPRAGPLFRVFGYELDAHRLGSDGRLSPETSLVLIFEEEGQELT